MISFWYDDYNMFKSKDNHAGNIGCIQKGIYLCHLHNKWLLLLIRVEEPWLGDWWMAIIRSVGSRLLTLRLTVWNLALPGDYIRAFHFHATRSYGVTCWILITIHQGHLIPWMPLLATCIAVCTVIINQSVIGANSIPQSLKYLPMWNAWEQIYKIGRIFLAQTLYRYDMVYCQYYVVWKRKRKKFSYTLWLQFILKFTRREADFVFGRISLGKFYRLANFS